MRVLFTLLVIAAVAGTGGWYWYHAQAVSNVPRWNTVKAEHGDINLTIRSTGTIEPQEVVDVGAQVVGMVTKFGEDKTMPNSEIYWQSKVGVGTILAYIDDSVYKAALDLAKANLQSAEAKVVSAQATLKDNTADYKRAQTTFAKNAISQSDLDAAEALYETAKANVDVAIATVAQDQANLNLAQTNENYTVIKSPVKGTIIDRRVNIGQTVVASLSAPSLFLIAQDLTKLQIWASVSEADIGQIHADQNATFKVDAQGEQEFKGVVSQVRLNATMNQNVVTYTVVVDTDNSDGKLLPYETATLEFDAGQHHGVLMVPNGALQWRPVGAQLAYVALEDRAGLGKSHSKSGSGGGAAASGNKKSDKDKLDRGSVWIFDGQWLRKVHVKIGVTDQVNTEILSGSIKDGDEVVIGEEHGPVDSDATENPFAPKIFKGGKK
ncbi:MAG TPA: efflux RND transporter periplasmic adaptor subunit [Pirellulales bacterium]|jgi:HlyD family secretion protein|nr:efflux RND transporter periplasmic adaptor subunit [Pirellulales bacterium]